MEEVYRRLAAKLDQMPNPFPATASGVELKILRKIFSPEEAEIALQLLPVPETAEQIAQRLGKPLEQMQALLDTMAGKGQIGSFRLFGVQVYAFFPFLPGIYEFQSERMDAELAALCEEYYPTIIKALGTYGPAMARVIPVQTEVQRDAKALPFEDVRRLLETAKAFQLTECICRNEMALTGRPCRFPLETCLMFSSEEGAFDRYTRGRVVSKAEAIAVAEKAEELGLVHITSNVENDPIMFLCNCCPCCCICLRAVKEHGADRMIARNRLVATVDPDVCTACGVCAEERCPMGAVAEHEGAFRVDPNQCIGCGVCTSACPVGAITLVARAPAEYEPPEASMLNLNLKRAAARGTVPGPG